MNLQQIKSNGAYSCSITISPTSVKAFGTTFEANPKLELAVYGVEQRTGSGAPTIFLAVGQTQEIAQHIAESERDGRDVSERTDGMCLKIVRSGKGRTSKLLIKEISNIGDVVGTSIRNKVAGILARKFGLTEDLPWVA
jgi:hypothetical protein